MTEKTHAYAAHAAKAPLKAFSFTRRAPGPNDVVIDIAFCGICHSDVHQVRDEWGKGTFPMVPGHEIVGSVVAVGDKVQKFKVKDQVGVGCMVDSCKKCRACSDHEEQFCLDGATMTYGSEDKHGEGPTYGGYSTRIVVTEDFVLRLPQNLDLAATAPLLCAGITTYSPLSRFGVTKGQKVAVLGLGGLGHMGVKIARAMGAHVTVLTHSEHKREDAKRLGANEVVVTRDPDALAPLAETFDFILDTVSAKHDYQMYLGLLRYGGAMVLVGLPDAPSEFHAGSLVPKRRILAGSLIGGIKETQEMLDFCSEHNIVSDIELIGASSINDAMDRMVRGEVKYRFVLDCASLAQA